MENTTATEDLFVKLMSRKENENETWQLYELFELIKETEFVIVVTNSPKKGDDSYFGIYLSKDGVNLGNQISFEKRGGNNSHHEFDSDLVLEEFLKTPQP